MCIRDSINAEYGDDGQRSMSEATAAAEAETQDANTGASAVSSEAAALIALAEAFGGARPEWSEFSAIPKDSPWHDGDARPAASCSRPCSPGSGEAVEQCELSVDLSFMDDES
eukprot:TRINITY_DN3693_c0_g2_i3.p1 TRINITY_DN3693_c0_g2~~TRINITY_DN3693_c0_g2_i3.p1  ORF type:complete len:113 (-),score=35.66 TRINITY_DN3693_c0_g2_i3:374-712(-)